MNGRVAQLHCIAAQLHFISSSAPWCTCSLPIVYLLSSMVYLHQCPWLLLPLRLVMSVFLPRVGPQAHTKDMFSVGFRRFLAGFCCWGSTKAPSWSHARLHGIAAQSSVVIAAQLHFISSSAPWCTCSLPIVYLPSSMVYLHQCPWLLLPLHLVMSVFVPRVGP